MGTHSMFIDIVLHFAEIACRWNIYHWLCYNKANVIVEYLLERLPQDVNEELLARKSKGKLTTVRFLVSVLCHYR